MAESQNKRSSQRVKGVLELVSLEGQPPPEFRLEAVSPAGERTAIEVGSKGEFQLPEGNRGKGYRLELLDAEGGMARRFVYDALLEQLREETHLRIPGRDLFVRFTCVSGRVSVCRYLLDPILPFVEAKLEIAAHLNSLAQRIDGSELIARWPYPWPEQVCRSVCQGRVQVFVQICCCPLIVEPPVILKRLCEIIDCHELIVHRPPHLPPDGPWGPHGPGPGPDPAPLRFLSLSASAGGAAGPAPGLERATVRALKRAEAEEGGRSAADVLVASAHLSALLKMSRGEQVSYIQSQPELLRWGCTCSSYKAAEVPLQADGRFDVCFPKPRLRRGCTARVIYRVSQAGETGWKLIYDGFASHESFDLENDAELHARWNAAACDDPHEYGPMPFVLLEGIGNTWADTLIHSSGQTGEKTWGPLATKDGLANEKPPGAGITEGPYDQPWATTLELHFQFHPGLEALGARFYRVRVVPIDNGAGGPFAAPVPTEFMLTDSIQWRKYNPIGGGGVGTHWEPLNDTTAGFYRIPFPDPLWPWLYGQPHARVDTQALTSAVQRMPNGRYLFLVDIFDANHKRLVPNGTLDSLLAGDSKKAFEHRRLDGPIDAPFSNTSVVPRSALGSLFRVDNLPCYADIEAIVNTGTPSVANCQFLSGPAGNTVQLQYSASQSDGFQWYHQISYKQGLTGPVTYLSASNANVSSGLSPSKTFDELLGGETKCAFAASLGVLCRHTSGSGRVSAFDRNDIAAFALEKT